MKTPQLPNVNWAKLYGQLAEAAMTFNWQEGIHDEASLRAAWDTWQNLMQAHVACEEAEDFRRYDRMLANIERMIDGFGYVIDEHNNYVRREL